MFAKYSLLALLGMTFHLAQGLPADPAVPTSGALSSPPAEAAVADKISPVGFDFHYSITAGVSSQAQDYSTRLQFSQSRRYNSNGTRADTDQPLQYTCVKAKDLKDGTDLDLSAVWLTSVFQTKSDPSLGWVVVFADDDCEEKGEDTACSTKVKDTKNGERKGLDCKEQGENSADKGSGIPLANVPTGAYLARSVAIYGAVAE